MAAEREGDKELRVSFIVGGLGTGGAEKQFVYILRALQKMNVSVQLLTLTQGETYEKAIESLGIRPIYIRPKNRILRIQQMLKAIRAFQPHFIQSTHFFTSFYAGVLGRLTGITSIGAIQGDVFHDLKGVGRSGKMVLRLPAVFTVNSYKGKANAVSLGLQENRLHILRNVIDLDEFDRAAKLQPQEAKPAGCVRAIVVARLIPAKRLERFIQALAHARDRVPQLEGWIVGGGPEETHLRAAARECGFDMDQPDSGLQLLGERHDVPRLLNSSDIFVLTSDKEGLANVLLEAMAASLPIITTPAGETPDLVKHEKNGYLVDYDDTQALTDYLVRLASSPELRQKLGNEGRRFIEAEFSFAVLENTMRRIYRDIAVDTGNRQVLSALDSRA